MAFIVSRYLSFKSCLCISEDPEYVNIKNQKIYDLFSMNVQCIFLKHAHRDFKKELSYIRTNFWQLYLLAPQKITVLH